GPAAVQKRRDAAAHASQKAGGRSGQVGNGERGMSAFKWWEFSQNNSGGSFDHDPEQGIGYRVLIEARNADEASARAQDIGIYFDGCRDGIDCCCCGDRWSEPWGEGDMEPT